MARFDDLPDHAFLMDHVAEHMEVESSESAATDARRVRQIAEKLRAAEREPLTIAAVLKYETMSMSWPMELLSFILPDTIASYYVWKAQRKFARYRYVSAGLARFQQKQAFGLHRKKE